MAGGLVPADDLPSGLVPADDLPDSVMPDPQIAADVQSAIGRGSYQPGFMDTLGREAGQGWESIRDAVMGPQTTSRMFNPYERGFQALSGASQIAFSPFTAAGSQIGETIGEFVRSKTEPLGPNISAALGTMAGAPANLATQIYGPSLVSSGASSAIQAGKRLKGRMLLGLPDVAQSARQMGAAEAEALPALTRPPTKSELLYAKVDQYNPQVDLAPLKPTLDTLLKEEALATEGLKVPTTTTVAGGLKKEFFEAPKKAGDSTFIAGFGREIEQVVENTAKGQAPFQQVRLLMRRINDKIGSLKAAGGEGLGDMLQLKKAFAQSLEAAADKTTGEAYKVLKEANTAFRREVAEETVTNIIQRNINYQEGRRGAGIVNINAGKAMGELEEAARTDRFLMDSFAPGAYERIMKGLDKIRQIPLMGAPPGVDAGSKRVQIQQAVGGAVGAAVGGALGYMGEGTYGAAAGVAAGGYVGKLAGIGAAELLSKAYATPEGAKLALKLIEAPGGLSVQKFATLATFLRAQQMMPSPKEFRAVMSDPNQPIEVKIQNAMERAQVKKMLTVSGEY